MKTLNAFVPHSARRLDMPSFASLNTFCLSSLSLKRTLLSLSLLTSAHASASGIFLQEAVIANAGTVGAGDGVYTQSAAAMWANPATMPWMSETLTTVNATAFDLKMDYHDQSGVGHGQAASLMPSVGLFHVRQLNEDVHFGIALGTVGGSSLDYGSEWQGAALMTDIALAAVQINPALGFRVTDQLSWGIGAQISWASLEMGMANARRLEHSSDWAYGFNAGVMYQFDEQWDLGVSFRSKVNHEFSTELSGGQRVLPVGTDLVVPAIVDVSSSYAVNPKLKLLASIQLHRWSEWDTTVFDFGRLDSNPLGLNSIDRQWEDVWKFAVATDYQLNADWRLKAGFSYETSPQDDPSKQWVDLPVGQQYRYSVGATTQWDSYVLDVYYEYADLGEVDIATRKIANQDVGINGTFEGRIHFVGLSVSF
ncbi:outer membrane beta-barrel protein [Vibrio vulnificus]|nr:outer membrane beta-barrel protein [Vibrio vulnificus]